MGKDLYDNWTFSHFAGGVMFRLAIFPTFPTLSFVMSVFIHLLGELVEKSPHPVTNDKESNINHWGDMIAFILGWFVGGLFNPLLAPYSSSGKWWKSARVWLLIIAAIVTIKEFAREVYITKDKNGINGIIGKILY